MAIRAVLFDYDGTLIDSVDCVWQEYQRTARVLKLPKRRFEDYTRQLGKTWEEALKNIWPGVNTKEFTKVYRLEKEQVTLLEGVMETLGRLKGRYKLGILTSRGRKTLYQHLKSTGIPAGLFGAILYRESLKKHKPDPKALYQACREMKVAPEEIVYVGDAVVDAQCAIAAGIRFIGVLTGGAKKQDFLKAGVPKDCIIKTLKELPEKLNAKDGS
jgi:HAD superfamily hydrolase (TIGR01509 family)